MCVHIDTLQPAWDRETYAQVDKTTTQMDASHIGSYEVKVARDQREKEVWCPHAYCSDAFADEDRPLLTFQTFGLMVMMMIAFIQ